MNEPSQTTSATLPQRPRFGSHLQLAAIVAIVCFYLLTLRDGHSWGGDFAHYIHHAENLATGRDYADTGYVYNPANSQVGPRAYPPVFPLLLLPTFQLFGLNLTAYKIQLIFVFAASLWVTARLFVPSLGESRTLAYLLLLGLCPVFWAQKDSIESEHLFIFLWYLAILIADRRYRASQMTNPGVWHAVLLGLVIYLACGTRTAGIVLLPALFCCELLYAKRITLFGVMTLAVATGLIVVERWTFPGTGSEYWDQLSQLDMHSLIGNLHVQVVSFSMMWANGYSDHIRELAGVVFSLIAVIGFCRDNRLRPSFLGVTTVLYFGAVIVWPSSSWLRMVIPLLPAYLFYVLLGWEWPRISPLVRRWGFAGFCLFVSISYGAWYSQADYGAVAGSQQRCALELFEYIRKNASDEDICLFFKPRVLCLYAECQATAYPSDPNAGDTWKYAETNGVSLVVVRREAASSTRDDPEYRGEREMMRAHQLDEVWRNECFRVLRRPPPRLRP